MYRTILSKLHLDTTSLHFLLLFSHVVTASTSNFDSYESSDTSELTKVIITNDVVIVGGKNVLFSLDSNLTLLQKDIIGPVKHSPKCLPTPETCDYERVDTDNSVSVLLTFSKVVLMCGSARQGICTIRRANNLLSPAEVGDLNDTVSFVGGQDTVVAFFGGKNNKHLYSAWSYDLRDPSLTPYYVSSRFIANRGKAQFFYSFSSETSISAVDFFDDNFKKQYHVYNVYGFSYGGFSYFISYQLVTFGSNKYETRIARVCQEDLTFKSYMEVPLKCQKSDDDYNMVSSAFLFEEPSTKREGGILYATFVKSRESNEPDRDFGTVMCSFDMSLIENKFKKEVEDCYKGEARTHLIEKFVGNAKKCSRIENFNITAALCNRETNTFIEGRDFIMGSLKVGSFSGIVKSLFVTEQGENNYPVAFFGTDEGHVVKLNLRLNDSPEFYKISVSNTAIEASYAVDDSQQNLYLLTGNKVVKFPIGSCSLYETCDTCLTRDDPIGCGWCDGVCSHECLSREHTTECPPYIHSISPSNGPIYGNTTVSIFGENFGNSHTQSDNTLKITIGDTDCIVFSWENEKVQCKTLPQVKEYSEPVKLEVDFKGLNPYDSKGSATSKELFSFLTPQFFGIKPGFGPFAGGTNVTIFGENLDIGANRDLILVGMSCNIYNVSSTTINCTTRPKLNKNRGKMLGAAQFFIDGHSLAKPQQIKFNGSFTYMFDPKIYNITPRNTIVSGGTMLRVIGDNLDSVINPKLVVRIVNVRSLNKFEIVQTCTHLDVRHQKGKTMLCPTPPLEEVSGPKPSAQKPVEGLIYFIMDGVEDLRNFTHTHPNISSLLYYPNPTYLPFDTNDRTFNVPVDNPVIVVKGMNLNLAQTKDDVKVFITGNIPCNIIYFGFMKLKCIVPSASVPSSAINQSARSIEITAGNLTYKVGYIKFVDPVPQLGVLAILAIVAGCIVFILIVLLILFKSGLIQKWKKAHHPNYAVRYVSDPEARRSNEYTDATRNLTNGGASSSESQPSVDTGGGACGGGAASISSRGSLGDKRIPEETVRLLEADGILYPRNYLTVREIIGQGHFGRVYRGDLTLPGKESRDVAVKTLNNLRYRDGEDCEIFLQEGLMMKDFHHHHVLTLIGVSIDEDGFPMVIIPYMANGDLLSFIRNENNYPTVKDLLTYGIHIAEGMKYLSDLKFLHRDLAARNCMLDEAMVVKVADFGLSRDIYERDYYSSDNKKSKLPVKWMAPESLEKGTYSTKSDVWAFGVVIWELLTRGVTPYPEVGNWEILQYVKSGRRMPQPSYCPDMLYQLMCHCWSEDPKNRPSFGDIAEEIKKIIKKMEAKNKHQRVGTKVTYVNYPVDDPNSRYANANVDEEET